MLWHLPICFCMSIVFLFVSVLHDNLIRSQHFCMPQKGVHFCMPQASRCRAYGPSACLLMPVVAQDQYQGFQTLAWPRCLKVARNFLVWLRHRLSCRSFQSRSSKMAFSPFAIGASTFEAARQIERNAARAAAYARLVL